MNRGNELNAEKMITENPGKSPPRQSQTKVALKETNLFEGHFFFPSSRNIYGTGRRGGIAFEEMPVRGRKLLKEGISDDQTEN